MEIISDTEEEQDQEEIGRLTQADKAHTGRVSFKSASIDFANNERTLKIYLQISNVTPKLILSCHHRNVIVSHDYRLLNSIVHHNMILAYTESSKCRFFAHLSWSHR